MNKWRCGGFIWTCDCIDNLTHSLSPVRFGHGTTTHAYTATVEAVEARGTQDICGTFSLFVCLSVSHINCLSSVVFWYFHYLFVCVVSIYS